MEERAFSQYLEFEFEGKILKNSMCLGDVDGDGLNELIVGNERGDVAIYKNGNPKPVATGKVTGTVSSITFGDALNIGKNVIVVVTTCGHLQVYYVIQSQLSDVSNRQILPVYSQRVMANIKSMMIGDVNGDNCRELIVGLTDRVVRTYRWVAAEGKTVFNGRFLGINKWDFADQVGGVALHHSSSNPCLLVSQPGGLFHSITVAAFESENDAENPPSEESSSPNKIKIECLDSDKIRNAEICGNVATTEEHSGSFVIATLDGLLMSIKDGKVVWRKDLKHPIFSLNCKDIERTGIDAVIACAWDGVTFIIQDGYRDVKFAFREQVSSFVAGFIGYQNKQRSCLIYATFNNKIYAYYDLYLPRKDRPSLWDLERNDDKFRNILENLNINPDDRKEIKKLNERLLYSYKK